MQQPFLLGKAFFGNPLLLWCCCSRRRTIQPLAPFCSIITDLRLHDGASELPTPQPGTPAAPFTTLPWPREWRARTGRCLHTPPASSSPRAPRPLTAGTHDATTTPARQRCPGPLFSPRPGWGMYGPLGAQTHLLVCTGRCICLQPCTRPAPPEPPPAPAWASRPAFNAAQGVRAPRRS